LPVLYIYTRHELDLDQFRTALIGQFPPSADLLVLYDVQFDYCLRRFQLGERQGGFVVAVPDDSGDGGGGVSDKSREDADQIGSQLIKFGRRFPVSSWEELSTSAVVFVSTNTGRDDSELRRLNLFFTFVQEQRNVFTYEVASSDGSGSLVPVSSSVSRLLRRRRFAVEKARDAERVGLLVGTLGTRDYPLILDRLRQTIRRAGKRCYNFLVGKPNVAKLANFPEIDVFVLVACPETSFPDTKVRKIFLPVLGIRILPCSNKVVERTEISLQNKILIQNFSKKLNC
jgi:diphthamide biosynthesis protein 2